MTEACDGEEEKSQESSEEEEVVAKSLLDPPDCTSGREKQGWERPGKLRRSGSADDGDALSVAL
jgi:hypothetical protein